jgi:hypothetical protein
MGFHVSVKELKLIFTVDHSLSHFSLRCIFRRQVDDKDLLIPSKVSGLFFRLNKNEIVTINFSVWKFDDAKR